MSTDNYNIIVSILAIVFIFLYAIHKFSINIENIFEDDIKKILHKWTRVPIIGALIGFIITAIVQSSTAMSVLLVAMTRSKLIPLAGALAVLIGVNLGTTLTIQLISFRILDIAPYIIILGFFLMKTRTKYQMYGESIFYFGIIFSCLYLISVITHPFADSPFMLQFASLSSNIWLGILIGFVLTNIVQSSTIMTSIIVILAAKGILDFDQSFALILGSNIGTTTTALIASLASNRDGKRVALAHFLFSFIGVILILPFVDTFSNFIKNLSIPLYSQVAFSHFLFNFVISIVFLVFFKYYKMLVMILIRDKK
ncbi:MAG: Na/Pi symporter [Candidatus Paceibacterota bacterium]|jgi:phosphate:Na+ symporter